MKRRSGIVRRPAAPDRATQPANAEGDENLRRGVRPHELPPMDTNVHLLKMAWVGPVVTELPAVPKSADCFGSIGRLRVMDAEAHAICFRDAAGRRETGVRSPATARI